MAADRNRPKEMEMTKGSASRRRRGIAAVATLAALACVAVLGLVAAQAARPATGNALRKALPGPGENKLKDTTEFTGVEASKRFAIAAPRAARCWPTSVTARRSGGGSPGGQSTAARCSPAAAAQP
jgi:hypothetical protein